MVMTIDNTVTGSSKKLVTLKVAVGVPWGVKFAKCIAPQVMRQIGESETQPAAAEVFFTYYPGEEKSPWEPLRSWQSSAIQWVKWYYEYIYIYIHVCIYIYIHTCVYIYIHTYICVYIYIYIHVYIYIHTYMCVYIYIHTCVYIYIYIHVYIYIYIHTCVYIYTYICVYIYTHIHIYEFIGGVVSRSFSGFAYNNPLKKFEKSAAATFLQFKKGGISQGFLDCGRRVHLRQKTWCNRELEQHFKDGL